MSCYQPRCGVGSKSTPLNFIMAFTFGRGRMTPMTSPDAPVFFLHHCFVDKVWADWQALQREQNPEASPHYAPETNGSIGYNLDDQLKP